MDCFLVKFGTVCWQLGHFQDAVIWTIPPNARRGCPGQLTLSDAPPSVTACARLLYVYLYNNKHTQVAGRKRRPLRTTVRQQETDTMRQKTTSDTFCPNHVYSSQHLVLRLTCSSYAALSSRLFFFHSYLFYFHFSVMDFGSHTS